MLTLLRVNLMYEMMCTKTAAISTHSWLCLRLIAYDDELQFCYTYLYTSRSQYSFHWSCLAHKYCTPTPYSFPFCFCYIHRFITRFGLEIMLINWAVRYFTVHFISIEMDGFFLAGFSAWSRQFSIYDAFRFLLERMR